MRENDHERLWFSLILGDPDLEKNRWSIWLNYFDGSAFSVNLRLRIHGWSHACTSVDAGSGHVIVVINGIVTHDEQFKNLRNNETIIFQNNLVLGVWQKKGPTSETTNQQSEASVTNLNIFSPSKSVTKAVELTSTGQCTHGNILSWAASKWTLTGKVGSISSSSFCKSSYFAHLYLLDHFIKFEDCISLCPRLQDEGRVPFTRNISESEHLIQQFKSMSYEYALDPTREFLMWSSFVYRKNGSFVDFYNGADMQNDLWIPGNPNGGGNQQCTFWGAGDSKARLYDVSCMLLLNPKCLCEFKNTPILRLRGLCKESNIDTYFTLHQANGHVGYKGLSNTEITYSEDMRLKQSPKWDLAVNMKETKGQILSKKSTYILGKHTWIITNDSVDCAFGFPNARELKLSGCSDGQFTCSNGDCVSMEVRCDQAIDCYDKSDEENCQIMALENSYRKTAPPVSLSNKMKERKVVPADVKVSLTLLDVSAIKEADNEIYVKFSAQFEWYETRATYHNLKLKSNQNSLELANVEMLWTPSFIYRNNKDNFNTRDAIYKANLKINRLGNFSRSGLDILEEIELFQGSENPIVMVQSYTKGFKCTYNLRAFPFDTQVSLTFIMYKILIIISRSAT